MIQLRKLLPFSDIPTDITFPQVKNRLVNLWGHQEAMKWSISIGCKDLISVFMTSVTQYEKNWAIITSISCMDISLSIIKLLVKLGSDYRTENEIVLRTAASRGFLNIVQWLVKKGSDIHSLYNRALRRASENGHLNVVKYLVFMKANIHECEEEALRKAAANGHQEVVEFLVEEGSDIHSRDDEAFRWAAENGHIEIVKYLIYRGSNINIMEEYAIRWSIRNGHIHMVSFLLDKAMDGMDVRIMDDYMLRYASKKGYKDLVITLIKMGSDIHAKKEEAFRQACLNGHLEVAMILLEHGACIGMMDYEVLSSPHLDVIEFLLGKLDPYFYHRELYAIKNRLVNQWGYEDTIKRVSKMGIIALKNML